MLHVPRILDSILCHSTSQPRAASAASSSIEVLWKNPGFVFDIELTEVGTDCGRQGVL